MKFYDVNNAEHIITATVKWEGDSNGQYVLVWFEQDKKVIADCNLWNNRSGGFRYRITEISDDEKNKLAGFELLDEEGQRIE